jgi:hypothetical protein
MVEPLGAKPGDVWLSFDCHSCWADDLCRAVDVKKLTSTIPIVFVVVADPIGTGLVEGR